MGLRPFLKPYKKHLILGPFFKLLEAVLELLLPLLAKSMVEKGFSQGAKAVYPIAGLMLLCAVLGLLCALVCQYYASVAAQGLGTSLRDALCKKVLSLPPGRAEAYKIPVLTSDTNYIQYALAMTIRLLIRAPFLCVGSVAMAFFLHPVLALYLLFAIPLFALLFFGIARFTSPLYGQLQQRLDKLALLTRQFLTGFKTLRAYNRIDAEAGRMGEQAQSWQRVFLRLSPAAALAGPLTALLTNGILLLLLRSGVFYVNRGELTQGDILAFVSYITMLFLALTVSAMLIPVYSRGLSSWKRAKILLNEPEQAEKPRAVPVPNAPLILLQNLAYTYPGSARPALSGLSLALREGETLGVIGGTGAGKTTLGQVLLGFCQPYAGQAEFLGVPLSQWDAPHLREQFSYAPQHPALFTGTVRDNLQLGAEYPEQALLRALEQAQCGFLTNKGGLDAPVQRDGGNFSGGQRQRLGLARALLKPCRLLLLDDTFSALDYATEKNIRKALPKGCAKIIISQRVASLLQAKKILVLENGRVSGYGTHRELLGTHPGYAEICRYQLGIIPEKEG